MSRGLGRIERTILDALQTTQRPYVALWELVCLIDGRVASLDKPAQHWLVETCPPHPKRRNILGYLVAHDASCYPPRPNRSVQEGVSRAVRSLARKGLVRCEYEGSRPKRLLVYLSLTDRRQLPKAQRFERAVQAHVLYGVPMSYRRGGM